MASALVTVYHRSTGGRVVAIDVDVDEAAFACARFPATWSLTPDFKALPAALRARDHELIEPRTEVFGRQLSSTSS
jgi:hypothetical protein